jgi:hypothetical protein
MYEPIIPGLSWLLKVILAIIRFLNSDDDEEEEEEMVYNSEYYME